MVEAASQKRSPARLKCPFCAARLSARVWPKSGDDVPARLQSEPGHFRLLINCPQCGKDSFVVWDSNPGPLQTREGQLLSADDLVADATEFIRDDRLPHAMERLDWALVRDPNSFSARQCLAVAFGKAGNITQAIAHLRAALQINSHAPETHYNLGAMYHRQGKTADAIRAIETALELDPNYAPAQKALQKLKAEPDPSLSLMGIRLPKPAPADAPVAAAAPPGAAPAAPAAAAEPVPIDPVSIDKVPQLRIRHELLGHQQDVRCVAFSPNAPVLVSGSTDGTLRIWDYSAPPDDAAKVTVHLGFTIAAAAFSSAGDKLAVAGGLHARIWLMDKNALRAEKIEPAAIMRHEWRLALPPPERRVTCAAFSPDGAFLVTGNESKIDGEYASVWNCDKRGALKQTLSGDFDAKAVAFSPGGGWLAVCRGGRATGAVDVWDAMAFTVGNSFTGVSGGVAFSTDGKLLAAGAADSTVKLWQVETGKPAAALAGHSDAVVSAAFSPDGRYLATGGKDHRVILWDVAGRRPVAISPAAGPGIIWSVAFSPDGKTLAVGSSSWKVLLFDVP
ncbi:MAG: tetratricopeptide repeat protein [Planctomycetia bacterium]|nr:tetratricopeptide repeat protein [Planctomycetia bacterium]